MRVYLLASLAWPSAALLLAPPTAMLSSDIVHRSPRIAMVVHDEATQGDAFLEEANRVAALVAEAKERSAAADAAGTAPEAVDLLGRVDVDLSLTMNEADAGYIQAEADAVFAAMDADGNGRISPSELRDHLAGSGFSKKDVERFFNALDTNSDGQISRGELRSGFRRYEMANLRLALGLAAGPLCELAQEADSLSDERAALASDLFDEIDANSDGSVSNSELRAHLESMGYGESTVAAIFASLDLDINGEISRDEMIACFARSEHAALRLAIAGRDAAMKVR